MTGLPDAETACGLLREAAVLIREDPIRKGGLLEFGSAGQVVMTGDMHGNLRNFEKLQRYCALERSPGRSVILHELIHEDIERADQLDLSIDVLLRAAQWKRDFPDNVFILQSNHELAQLRGQEISKGGRSVLWDFEQGVVHRFGPEADAVLVAARDYISALPLAARTRTGIFMCHSLPNPFVVDSFDISVFERPLTEDDIAPGGSAYNLLWGRFHSTETVERFAERLGVECFIIGHTPQEGGHTTVGRLIILASEHNHGAFLPIDLSQHYTVEELESKIRKFVSLA
ncbi:MAG: metallophosphoesterase [Planctomycetes bacterium]|nr:metallophosphoesterase [Planctomycetota bacterium]